jgi:hypothetical protein
LVPAANIFIDAPPSDLLGNLARGGGPFIDIFDLKLSRNTTRWPAIHVTQEQVLTGLVSTVSGKYLPLGASQTITLSGPLVVGDAVSCILQGGVNTNSACVSAIAGDTLDTLAAKLAAAINTPPPAPPPTIINLSNWVTATASGAIVTIQNIINTNFNLFSFTGNNGATITEWARYNRGTGIVLWTATQPQRDLIAPIIASTLGQLQNQFGFQCPDSTWVRVMMNSDIPGRDDQNNDIWRWVFMIDMEMGVTTQDVLYEILGTTIQKFVGY